MRMRVLLMAGATGAVVMLTGCVSHPTEAQFAELEKSNREILARLDRLEEQNRDAVTVPEIFEVYLGREGLSPALWKKYLAGIELPPDATEPQLTEYLEKLYALRTLTWNSEQAQDLIAAKVIAAGHKGLPLMFAYAESPSFQRAIQRLITAEDKPLLLNAMNFNDNRRQFASNLYLQLADASDADVILANLARCPQLITAVIRLGLEKQAAPVIVKSIVSSPSDLNFSVQWLQVALPYLEGAEKQQFMEQYWPRLMRNFGGYPGNIFEPALQLAKAGFLPAFEFLVKNASMMRNEQQRIGQLMPLTGLDDPDQLQDWYVKNRGRIVFDPVKQQYVVTEPAK